MNVTGLVDELVDVKDLDETLSGMVATSPTLLTHVADGRRLPTPRRFGMGASLPAWAVDAVLAGRTMRRVA